MNAPWQYTPDNISDRRPRRDDGVRKRLKPADVLVRAAVSELLRREDRPGTYEAIAETIERVYGNCPATLGYVLRATASPANTTVAGWAAELVATSVLSFIENDMQRTSGFAQLAQRALVVPFDNVGSVSIPARSSPLSLHGAWVAEGGPKPVYAGVLGAVSLAPYKLSAVSSFTEEMLQRSSIEAIVRETLAHDLSALLDTALFDATAVSATRPAGLWNGATAITASALTPANEAMLADLKGLAAAVGGTGNPDASVTFVVNPAQAIRVSLLAPGYANLIVSGYQTAGSVGAIDANSVAMLVGTPQFQISRSGTLHMETSPLALGSGVQGSGTLAVPTRSLFQEDLVGLRCVLRAGWVKRRATATALASAVIW